MHPHLPATRLRAMFLIAACAVALRAQDVTVTPPAWFGEDNADADQPAQIKGHPSIDFPAELRKSDETGYVLMGQSVDAKGKVVRMFQRFTHPYFRRAVEVAHGELDMRPAKKAGKPVESYTWYAVIFNPASAKMKSADAGPRLLAVSPVFISKDRAREYKNKQDLPTVWASLKLTESGQPAGFTLESPDDEKFRSDIDAALAHWRFAPARRDGVATASEMRVAFMIVASLRAHASEAMSPPRVLHREHPFYPRAMRGNGMRGEVVLGFTVTKEGKVVDPVIVRSTNPGFEEAALEAVSKWTFHPALRDGKPVNAKMQTPIVFELRKNGFREGEDAYRVTGKANTSKLPPELQFDTPAKVRGVIVPVYPYALLRDGVKGKVTAGILIDEAGKVVRVEIVNATHPEFASALSAALEMFTFEPALKNGKPTTSLLSFEQEFSLAKLPEAADLLSTEKKHPEKIIAATELDAPLKPLSRRASVFPPSLYEKTNVGEAVVEVLVDDDGNVRLPRIVSASEPAFGYSAVQAISQWRFESPTHKGKHVLTRVRAPFKFSLTNTAEPPGAEPKH